MNRRITELGLVLLASHAPGPIKPSRTKSLYSQLGKAARKDIARHSRLTWYEQKRIESTLEKFLTDLGWFNSKRHSGTVISFVADMLDRSDIQHSPKILEVVNLIVDHLENGNHLKGLSCWAGSVAADKWQEVVKCKEGSVDKISPDTKKGCQ